ncbi:hypothetical protein KGG70_gp23 [Streptomyces phage Celia]|uniref:Uncharacterized protein n=1 Tax=Streptomyces phage Celia TaxID=2590946 RepID=A0A516KRE0_9CAUD|nr:hypothetical protein KGG70_gp23 [Streptomyces phage Celia]QDP44261.1 hypothetical protein SEA_CELIA_58 [Streptomyces phage Celia]QFG10523.1 hypothetical protein SEA_URZA_60 [Streptomyces phage Urza]QJD50626.1 hypothetical protein SEA_ITZA_61 [Streptomyces phage Itza]
MRYLKVEIEGRFINTDITTYVPLEEGDEKDDALLEQLAQEAVNQEMPWGFAVVDESEVPEGERF